MREMKTLSMICDNRPYREGLMASWGLSIGLKDETGWTLFDLGNSPPLQHLEVPQSEYHIHRSANL